MSNHKKRSSKKLDFLPNRENRYSIRKFTVGTASILVGTLLYLGVHNVNNEVQAAENDTSIDANNSVDNNSSTIKDQTPSENDDQSIESESETTKENLQLEKSKDAYTKNIQELNYLSDNQRHVFITKIEEANSESEIYDIFNDAKIAAEEAQQEEEKAKQEEEKAKQEEEKAQQETKQEEESKQEDVKKDNSNQTENEHDNASTSKDQKSKEDKQEDNKDSNESSKENESEDIKDKVDEKSDSEDQKSKEDKQEDNKDSNESSKENESEDIKDKVDEKSDSEDQKSKEDKQEDNKDSNESSKENESEDIKDKVDEKSDQEDSDNADKSKTKDNNQEKSTNYPKGMEEHTDDEGNLDEETKDLVQEISTDKTEKGADVSEQFKKTLDKADSGQKEMLVNAILNSNLDEEQVASAKENLDIDYNKSSSEDIVDAITAEALKQAQNQSDLFKPAVVTNAERTSRFRSADLNESGSGLRAKVQTLAAVQPPQNNTDYKELVTVKQVNNNNNSSTKNFHLTVDQINVTYLPNGQIKLRIPVSTPKGINLGFNAKNRIDIDLSDSMKQNLVSVKNMGEEMEYDESRGTYFIEKNKGVSVTAEGNNMDVEVILNTSNFKPSDNIEIRYNRQVNLGLTAIDKSAIVTFGQLSNFINKQKEVNDQIQAFDGATDDEKTKMLETVNKANTETALTSATNAVLDQAKTIGKSNVNALENLSNNDKSVFNSRIQEAKTISEIDAIVDEAISSDQTKGLNKAKADANTQIDALVNLTNDEKASFKEQVNNVTDKSDIAAIVEQANQQNKTNELNKAKETANKQIDGLKDLSSTEKAEFKDRINSVTSVDQIQPIVKEAQTKQKENVLQKSKENALQTIDGLSNLSSEEKETYKNNVQSAKNSSDVQSALSNARAKDTANALEQAKKDAIQQLESLTNLPAEEKETFTNSINNATNINQIQPILDSAKARDNVAAQTKAKESANAELDKLSHLTETELEDYKKRIDGSTNQNQINTILDNAKIKNNQNELNKAKEEAKNTIEGLSNLEENERSIYTSQIDQANSIEDIERILEQAQQEDQTELLNNVKNNAKNTIDSLSSITPEEKEALKERIDNADNETAVTDIVNEAKTLNQQKELDNLRENANTKIDGYEYLSVEEKEAFKERIASADTRFAINSILSEARVKNDQNELRDAKQDALAEIESLNNLTSEEKDIFKSVINGAQSSKNIGAIVEQAKELDTTNELNNAKEEAINTIADIEGLSDAEKQAFNSQIENANSESEIEEIVNRAQQQADDNTLNKVKSNAISNINNLENLSEDEKNNFIDDINAATTTEAVNEVISRANDLNDQHELENAKDLAKTQLTEIEQLTDEQRDTFNDLIDNAINPEMVNSILEQAKQQEKNNILDDLKEKAVESINQLPNLTEEEKNEFISLINNEQQPENIEGTVNIAKQFSDIIGAVKEAVTTIDDLSGLSEEEKNEYKTQLENVQSVDEVNEIVENATKASQENELSEAKNHVNSEIDGLSNLNEEQKNEFKERVENATTIDEVNKVLDDAKDISDKKGTALEALKAVQAEGDAVEGNSYTPNSYKPLEDALAAAEEIINNSEDHTQAEIDEATEAVKAALEGLNERADKGDLEAAISEANGLALDENDAEDKAVADALAQAEAVASDDNATAEEVKTATDALNAAIKAKETQDASDKKAAALEALKAVQAEGNAEEENNYTPNSYKPLEDALAAAEEIINNSEDHTQAEIDEATEAVKAALEGLNERADKGDLEAAISEANGLALDENDAEDKAVADALAQAEAVASDDNATAEEVKTATDALNAAIKAKETQDASDKKAAALEALKAVQAEGNAEEENNYTPNSYKPLEDALAAAEEIINNSEDHTQAEIDEATEAVKAALEGLNERADKGDLEATISEANGLALDENDAEDKAVADALAQAEAVASDDNATAEEVKTATDALNAAIKAKETQDASDKKAAALEALKAVQAEGNGKEENNYTPNSYKPLEDALAAAEEIINNSEDHTQAEIDEATEAVKAALEGLNERADKGDLEAAISEANGLALDENDAEDKAVADALAQAEAVASDDNATAEEVKTATDALNAAIKAKETQDASDKKAAALEALKAVQAEGNGKEENNYTPNSYKPLEDALAAAEEIINNSEDHTQAEIDEATEAVKAALEGLNERADKGDLEAAISEANGLALDENDAEDKAVADALAQAEAVASDNNATAEEVKTATDALNAAIKAKETQDASDKKAAALEALKAVQAEGNAEEENNYTPNSYKPLEDALAAAEEIINNSEDHTQAEIDEATEAVKAALEGLNERADKGDLEAAISEANGLALDENDAEDKAVADALAQAEAVASDDNATAEEVKTATDALNAAIKAKETQDASDKKAAALEALKAVQAEGNAEEENNYTPNSYKPLEDALAAAEEIINNSEDHTQAEIDEATEAVKAALEGLNERADKGDLEAAISEANGLALDENDAEDKAVADALAQAEAVASDDNATAEEVKTATDALNAAIKAKETQDASDKKAAALEALKAVQAEGNAEEENNYTPNSYKPLEDALAAAEEIINNSEDHTQAEIDEATEAVKAALEGLNERADKGDLDAAISEANGLALDENDAEDKAVADALAQAEAVASDDNATAEEVKTATDALNAAIKAKETQDASDKKVAALEALKAVQAEGDAVEGNNYTPNSYKPLEDALAAAEEIINNSEDHTQAEIDEATEAVKAALEGLNERADKGDLEAAISEANGLELDENDAEDKAVADALAQAEAVASDNNATAEEVKTATDALNAAIKAKETQDASDKKAAALEALKAVQAEGNGKEENNYTPNSYKPLEDALAAAEEIINNSEDHTQAEIDEATEAVKAALEGLNERADKGDLEAAISEANGLALDENDAEDKAVADALAQAEAVASDDNATAEEVKTATDALNAAIKAKETQDASDKKAAALEALKAVQAEGNAEEENNYTPNSYKPLEDALAAAEEIINNSEDHTQAEIDEATEAVKAALEGLNERADKGDLEAAISEANGLALDENDAEDKAVADALAQAEAVASDDNATAEEVKTATDALNAAIKAKETQDASDKKVAALEALKAVQAEGDAVEGNNYTPNSYKPLEDALAAAEEIINNSEDHTQAEIDEATEAVKAALEGLNERADKGDLEAAISEANGLELDENDAEDKAVADALAQAEAVASDNNATAEEVKTATDALNAAIKAKETQDASDKKAAALEALKAVQAEGNGKEENNYTPNSYKPLEDALAAAEEIINNSEDHTQAEIDEATEAVKAALEGLNERADKGDLEAAISEANGLALDENDAEDKAVADALAQAEAVASDDNATAEEVKTATDALNAAIKAKETQDASDKKAAALEALKAVQAEGNAEEENNYTPNSYKPLEDALAAAEEIINNSEDHTQAEIDEATEAVKAALEGLNERADKGDLEAAISEANGLALDENDAEDKAVADALAQAEAVASDDNATAEEVKTATDALNAAIKAKETQDASDKKAAALEALKAVQAEGNAEEENNYTPNSYKPLEDALAAAEEIINNSEDHTQAEIDEATKAVKAALEGLNERADKGDLEAAISEANGLALDENDAEDKAVADALAQAEAVASDDNATAEEVKTATDALNAAIKAKETQDASDLSNVKEKAKTLIENLENLTAQQQAEFINKVEDSSSVDDIDKIVEEAKVKDLEMHALNESKNQGIETVNNLPGLTDDERAEFINRINQSETVENVQEIVKEATEQSSASELEKAKAFAKQEVDGLIYLSDEAKASYKDQIDKAKSQAEIDEIVKAAKEANDKAQADKALADAKAKGKQEIEDLGGLSDEAKAGYKDQIDKAKSQAEIDEIVKAAKEANDKAQADKALADAKAKGKQEIEDLGDLSDEAKAGYKDQIDKAKSQAEIDEIVENAKKESQVTNDGDSDASSHDHHDNKLTDNTNGSHQDIDGSDNGSNNTTGITVDSSSVDKAKDEAKQFINQLPKLSEQQQGNFNQRIEKAETVQQVQDIVDEASVVNNHLPDTGMEDNQSTTIFGSVVALLAGLLLLRRRKDKKNE